MGENPSPLGEDFSRPKGPETGLPRYRSVAGHRPINSVWDKRFSLGGCESRIHSAERKKPPKPPPSGGWSLHCPPRGMGENPSPLGEDFSRPKGPETGLPRYRSVAGHRPINSVWDKRFSLGGCESRIHSAERKKPPKPPPSGGWSLHFRIHSQRVPFPKGVRFPQPLQRSIIWCDSGSEPYFSPVWGFHSSSLSECVFSTRTFSWHYVLGGQPWPAF